jgi:hypothetical protein
MTYSSTTAVAVGFPVETGFPGFRGRKPESCGVRSRRHRVWSVNVVTQLFAATALADA